MTQTLDELVVKLSADITGFKSQMDAASAQVAQFSSKTSAQLSSIEASFKTLSTAAEVFGIALGVEGIVNFGKELIDTAKALQSLQFQMIAAVGSTDDANQAIAFTTDLANRLGLAMLDTGKGFATFALNAIRSGMSLQDTEQAYEGLAVEMRAVNLSGQQVQRTMNALTEIMSLGQVQTRQLRMLNIDAKISWADMAAAMGLTVDQFKQMVEQGKVVADDFLPKLASTLKTEFAGAAVAASDTVQANLNRLNNAWIQLQATFLTNGGIQAANGAIKALTDILSACQPVMVVLADTAKAVEVPFAQLAEVFELTEDELAKLIAGFGEFYDWLSGDKADQAKNANVITALNKQIQDTEASWNDFFKKLSQPVQMPDVKLPINSGAPSGEKPKKTSKVTQNQLDSVEKYAADDDDARRLQIQLQEHQAIVDKALAQGLITQQQYNQDSLDLEVDYEKRMGDYVAKNFGTEIEQENQNYKDRLGALQKALNEQVITQQQYQIQVEKLDKDHKNKLIAAENAYNKSMKSDQQDALEGFLGIQLDYQSTTASQQGAAFANSLQQAGQYNRTFFELAKAAAIAKALLSARQAVVDSYAFGASLGGPPLGAVFAGVAAAAEAVNVAAIASTSFGGGGSVAASGGSAVATTTDSTSSGTSNSITSPTKQVFINFQSGSKLFTDSQVRDLLKQINDALSDGAQLNVVSSN